MFLNAGELVHRITIQNTTESQSSSGEVTDTWGTFAVRWARIKPASGREFFASDQLNSELTHKINIRHLPGVTSKMRILFGSRVFEIVAPPINIMERNRETVLMCKEDV